jgi:hypothetical protein
MGSAFEQGYGRDAGAGRFEKAAAANSAEPNEPGMDPFS